MGGSLLSKVEVPGSSLLGHLPKEFSLRLTWCPWLVGYYGTRGISRGARKLARTPSLSKKKKHCLVLFPYEKEHSNYDFFSWSLNCLPFVFVSFVKIGHLCHGNKMVLIDGSIHGFRRVFYQ